LAAAKQNDFHGYTSTSGITILNSGFAILSSNSHKLT
jgi:hypothetical protein